MIYIVVLARVSLVVDQGRAVSTSIASSGIMSSISTVLIAPEGVAYARVSQDVDQGKVVSTFVSSLAFSGIILSIST